VPALQGGKQIVPGKSPLNTMPSDYLKSDLFHSVARYQGGARKDPLGRIVHTLLDKGPSIARVGASLGIAGLGYAGLKNHMAKTHAIETARAARNNQPVKLEQPEPEDTQKTAMLADSLFKKAIEKLKGGAADNMADSRYSKKELSKGIKHEGEHTKDKHIAKEIAKDHLEERKNYYTMLAKTKIGSSME
jgi:hypothetical protein